MAFPQITLAPEVLPQDCDQTGVSFLFWSEDRTACLSIACVVLHHMGRPVFTNFPPDWRVLVRQLGFDPYDSDVEVLLRVSATRAFFERKR